LNGVVPSAHRRSAPDGDAAELFVAVVHTEGSICFVAASTLRDELLRQLADYVRRQAPVALWAADEERVRALLEARQPEAAIEHYFARVGGRWDAEWLVTSKAAVDALADPVLALRRSRAAGTVYVPSTGNRRSANARGAARLAPPALRIDR
jgi:hypothetical protein